MKRVFGLALLGVVLAVPALVWANGDDLNGNWKLTTLASTGTTETTNWVIKLETTDGKTTATVVTANPGYTKPTVTSFKQTGDHIRLAVQYSASKKPTQAQMQVFEGHVTKDGKKIVGVVGQSDTEYMPAYMAPSDLKELDPTDIARKLPPEEFKSWAETASMLAKEHNAPWALSMNSKFASIFLTQKITGLAVQYAFAAEKALSGKTSTETQMAVLETLGKALKAAGRDEELATVTERLAKLEKVLDDEYLVKVPPFKGERFGGRKADSDRVVVMELFTGAECPPCVAADVAFDVLQKTYRPTEVALLQYHLHMPGPDPMTNSDTEARAAYYGARSTPSTFFDGLNKASSGGAMAAAEKKYHAYRDVIEPLLEQPADCKVSASAKRVGTKIEIKAEVAGLKEPGKNMKLRMVLVEETVRFVGGNKLRFHHHVVRAMPGTPAGVEVNEATLSWKSAVELPELRKQFVDYLDNYAANKRAFPRVGRPMSMDHLRFVAFVQDDTSKDILQAVIVDVTE